MKRFIYLILLAALAAFMPGCGTTGASAGNGKLITQEQLDAADKVIAENQAIIGAVLDGLRGFIVAKTLDPVERQKVLTKIAGLGNIVYTLVDSGKFDPATFRAVFQINDADIDQYLSIVPAGYQIIYRLSGGNQKLLHDVLEAIAGGLGGKRPEFSGAPVAFNEFYPGGDASPLK